MLWTTKYNYSVPHHNHLLCDLQHSRFQEPRCYRYPVCNGKIARLSPCVIFHCIVDDLHKGVRLESLSNFHVNLAVKVQVDTISDLTYQWIILKIIQIQSNFGPTDFGGWSYKFTPVCRRSFRQSLWCFCLFSKMAQRIFHPSFCPSVWCFCFYSKMALRIFSIFCMSVEDNRTHRLSKMVLLKILYPGL